MKNFKGSVLLEAVADYMDPKDIASDPAGPEVKPASSGDSDFADSFDEYEHDENSENADESEEGSVHSVIGNAGWADAMSKILRTNKPKKRKTVVLSRAKTIQVVQAKEKKKENYGFEIEGGVETEKLYVERIVKSKKLNSASVVKRKEWESRGRFKPTLTDQGREKVLSKIAIKGIVQLFNAVQKHQAEVGNKLKGAGASEIKRERVLKSIDKRTFLDVLMGSSKSEMKTETKIELRAEEPKSSAWGVLREDFLTDTNLKDWDKEPEEDQDMDRESLSSDDNTEMVP